MANASIAAAFAQKHQRKSDKPLDAKRKAISLKLVKVFAPTPAERAAAEQRKANTEAAMHFVEVRPQILWTDAAKH